MQAVFRILLFYIFALQALYAGSSVYKESALQNLKCEIYYSHPDKNPDPAIAESAFIEVNESENSEKGTDYLHNPICISANNNSAESDLKLFSKKFDCYSFHTPYIPYYILYHTLKIPCQC